MLLHTRSEAPTRPRSSLSTVLLGLCTAAALGVVDPIPMSAQDAGTYDLLIRGARVLDGTGNPWYRTDVGVRDGVIVTVAPLPNATAEQVIDATGLYLAPGFIDIHSHGDDTGNSSGLRNADPQRRAAPNLVAQGITTVVINHDGRSPWPIAVQRDSIAGMGLGPNAALLVGHGAIRSQVMGNDAARPSTPDEVEQMKALVRQAVSEGAWGISAGLEYSPGRYSTTEEVAALVSELAPIDGVYISHERSEGGDPMWFWPSQDDPGPPTLMDAVLETIEIGRLSGQRVVASHIKAKGTHYWGASGAIIQMIERARAEGVRVWADQYPYPTSGTDGNTTLLPSWAIRVPGGGRGGGGDEEPRPTPADILEQTLTDPALASDLRQDVQHEIRRRGGADRVVIFESTREDWVGQSVQDIADDLGVDAVEAAIQIQLLGDRERNGGARMRGFSMSEIDVEAYAAMPWVATTTDGGIALPTQGSVHPRFYGTFPRKIGYYARDRGVLSIEEAVRVSTSLPATIMGIADRGRIQEGYRADLVLFDLEAIQDETTFFEPHAYPSGIPWVFVNGRAVIENGAHTWELPGEILKHPRIGAG